jgi:hypothetical protein
VTLRPKRTRRRRARARVGAGVVLVASKCGRSDARGGWGGDGRHGGGAPANRAGTPEFNAPGGRASSCSLRAPHALAVVAMVVTRRVAWHHAGALDSVEAAAIRTWPPAHRQRRAWKHLRTYVPSRRSRSAVRATTYDPAPSSSIAG